MSKKFIAARSQFFKNSNASGEMAHVDRLFKENVNAFSEYTKYNFGSDFKLYDRYKELHQQRNEIRKSRKDSTTFVDVNLIFSLDQWEFLEEKYSPENLRKGMKKMMDDYLLKMKKEFGLEPIGYKFHLDEGHIKQFEAYQNQQDRLAKGLVPAGEKLIEKSDLIRNIHAHVLFYNFDFEKKISPWRKISKKQTSQMQDIAHECFKRAGFERGISKEITQKKNKTKEQLVADKLQEQQEKIEQLEAEKAELQKEVITLTKDKEELKTDNLFLKQQNNALKASLSRLFEDFKGKLGSLVKTLLKRDYERVYDQIEEVQQVIDTAYDDFDESTGNRMTNDANEVAELHYGDKPFKKNKPTL